MKTKRTVLVGLMALSLLGGVGGALALTRNAASMGGTTGAFDQAIYLNWDSDQATKSLSDVTDLSAGVAQWRYLTVAPKSTKTVSGTVTLTFTLAAATGDYHIKGLTVSVYKTASLATDGTVATLVNEVTPAPVLSESNLSGTTTFAVTTAANAHETTAYYAIKVLWTGANDPAHTSYVLGGSINISQAFAAN